MTDEKKLYRIINYGTQYQIDEMFRYIYDKYKPLMVFVASRYLSDDEDIKDIVQETFLDFFKVAEKKHSNIKAYLTIACKHNSLDLIKKKKRIYIMNDDEIDFIKDDVVSHVTYNEIIDELKLCLSKEEFEIVYDHLVEGLTFEDIGKSKSINTNSIKSIYYRTLKKYKKMKGIK